jgi:hypothetical protein
MEEAMRDALWSLGVALCVVGTACSSAADADTDANEGAQTPDAPMPGAGGASRPDAAASGGGGAGVKGGSSGTGGVAGKGGGAGTSGKGGAAGAGGATGTGGQSGPHTVGPCTGLAGEGVWEDISPPQVNLDPNFKVKTGTNFGFSGLVVDPMNTTNVYVGTTAQGIYKTTDCGSTWVHINTGRNGTLLDDGGNWSMVIDPVDPRGVLYANSGYGHNGVFKSTNGGVDWDQILPADNPLIYGGFVHIITIDPTDHLHLLVSPHFECVAPHTTSCLMETKDGGATWGVIDGTPSSQEGAGRVMLDSDTWLWAVGFGGLMRTSDHGKSWANVANANGYATGSLYRAPGGALYLAAVNNIIKSSDGISWTALANSPGANNIAGSATRLYANHGYWWAADQAYQPYSYAPLDAPTTWKTMPTPPMWYGGGMEYDSDHKILYSSNACGGVWRVVTP